MGRAFSFQVISQRFDVFGAGIVLLNRHRRRLRKNPVEIAPCGRGSESALLLINSLPSRDHRE
jgi:hypothetical protein